jgi:hypothetical protein
MRPLLLSLFLAATAVHGQEVIDTGDGSYRMFVDSHGRCVRTVASDGVVVEYLYDSALAQTESGVVIKVPAGPALKILYDYQGSIWARGMPKLKVIMNEQFRVTEIRADEKPIVTFEYRPDKYVGAVSSPGHFSMRFTTPDARNLMHQTLVDADGAVIKETDVVSFAGDAGIWNRAAYEGVEHALGFDPSSLSFHCSPGGFLCTGRDAKDRVALYFVTAGAGNSVAFTPDGTPRFYDLNANIWDFEIPPGGDDLGVSVAFDQNKAVPAHVTLTANGMPGVYIETPANGAIYAVWVQSDGHGGTVPGYARATATDVPTPAKRQ